MIKMPARYTGNLIWYRDGPAVIGAAQENTCGERGAALGRAIAGWVFERAGKSPYLAVAAG
jgi:hypothetical protein